MEKIGEDIIKGFFRERFGGLVAEELFRDKLKQMHIPSFDRMSAQEKIATGQQLIEDICKDFVSEAKLKDLKILYLLRFSLNEAGKRLEELVHKPCEISIEPPKDLTEAEIDRHLAEIEKPENICFIFDWSSGMKGAVAITMPRGSAVPLARAVMQALMQAEGESDELNELKISAIEELFKIIIPVFTKVVGDSLNQAILFEPLGLDDFRAKYFPNSEFIEPELTLVTTMRITIHETKTDAGLFFFVNEAEGEIRALLNEAHRDPFEEAPPRIVVRKTGNPRGDLEHLFSLLKIPKENIDFLLKAMRKDGFERWTPYDFSRFYNTLIEEFLPHSSENKKLSVKANLSHILPVAGPVEDEGERWQ